MAQKLLILWMALSATAGMAAQVGEKPGDQAEAAARGSPPTEEAKRAFIRTCWRTLNCYAPPAARNPNAFGPSTKA